MAYTFPDGWHSLHRPTYFELDPPITINVVSFDSGGFHAYRTPSPISDIEGTRYIFQNAGLGAGKHMVTSITDDTTHRTIVTASPHFGNSATTADLLWPFKIRIWQGFPTPVATDIHIDTYYGPDGKVRVNVAPFLREFFRITWPVVGVDENMFKWFRLEVVPQGAWATYQAAHPGNDVVYLTGYNFLADILWVANSALPHDQLQALALSSVGMLINVPFPTQQAIGNIFFSLISSGGVISNILNPATGGGCIDRLTHILWLNQAGGWSSFNFETKRSAGFTAGDNSTFKTGDLVKKFSARENKYYTYSLSSGHQSKVAMDYLETMFDSIQAFHVDGAPNPWPTADDPAVSPIVIDPKDAQKYRMGSGLWEIQFGYSDAREKIIQTQ